VYTPTAAEYASGFVVLLLTTDDPAGPCSFDTASVIHHFYQNPVVNFSPDDPDGCPVHCVQFTDNSTVAGAGASIASWNWGFGDGSANDITQNPAHCFVNTGFYDITLTVTSNFGCTSTQTAPMMIQVFPIPVADFHPDPVSADVLDPEITFNDFSFPGGSGATINYWDWDFGDGDTVAVGEPGNPNPTHLYPDVANQQYLVTLVVENSYGCWDTVPHYVYIGPEFTFFIPNAFTPNGDGINDYFQGAGIGIAVYDIWIFDRWGNMIWHTEDLSDKWNGKANGGPEQAQQDVFVWKVKLLDVFGKTHRYMGTVTLVK
jgi:gliding motility-associated-like protein